MGFCCCFENLGRVAFFIECLVVGIMNGWDLAGILLLVLVVDTSVIWAFSRGCRFCDVDGWGLDLGEVGYQTENGH